MTHVVFAAIACRYSAGMDIKRNFNTRALAAAAGYKSAGNFLSDLTRYELPINSQSSRFSRDNVYGPVGVTRALVLGKLRRLDFPASRTMPYLAAVDEAAIEAAWERFAANQCGELWLAVSPEDGSVICESRDELIKVLPHLEMALVFNLGAALGIPVEQKGKVA